jgi:hypothetical protein
MEEDQFQIALGDVISAMNELTSLKHRAAFFNPIMFQEMASPLSTGSASEAESLAESIRKSEAVSKAHQKSINALDDALARVTNAEEALAKLRKNLIAQRGRLQDQLRGF